MTRIQLTRNRSRVGLRRGTPSGLMIILIGIMLFFGDASSDGAQKHRKYFLPGFHTGQGGLIERPFSRWHAEKHLIQKLETMPIRIDLVIPMPVLRMMSLGHRRASRD